MYIIVDVKKNCANKAKTFYGAFKGHGDEKKIVERKNYSFIISMLLCFPKKNIQALAHTTVLCECKELRKAFKYTGASQKIWISWKTDFFFVDLFLKVKLSYIF